MHYCQYSSPLGIITIAAEKNAIRGLWFEGQKYFPSDLPEYSDDLTKPLTLACRWLDAYFAGNKPPIDMLPLAPQGSTYQQLVWSCLPRIPYGQTVTYGRLAAEVALRLGTKSMSAQAIGGAVGKNPISVIIPCHRVVGANGSLTGYAGGIERKMWLLQHEGVELPGTR